MKRLTIDGRSIACPFADLLRPLTNRETANLDASIVEEDEILVPVQTYLSERYDGEAFLDGHNRAAIGIARGMEVPIFCRGKMTEAKAKRRARALNVPRRHLTPEEQAEHREERIEKVSILRSQGLSLRSIAAEVDVTPMQVHRDLTGVTPVTPANPPPVLGIVGIDGKRYSSTGAPRRKVKRKSVPEKMLAQVAELTKLLKRFTAGKAAASNRERAIVLAATHGVPLVDGVCPWFATLSGWLRDLK